MAINHMDNFNIYGTTSSLLTQGIYADRHGALVNFGDGKFAYREFGSLGNNGGISLRYPLSIGATPKVGMAWRQYQTSLMFSNNVVPGVGWRGAGNEILAYVGTLSNGGIRFIVRDAGNNNVFYETLIPVITANAWWHYEAYYERTGTNTANIEIRVEGQTILQETGISCRAFDPAQCGPAAWANFTPISGDVYWRDFVVWDGTGAQNTSFLGSVLVTELLPTADVSLNWTPSTGAVGWSILDNVPPNNAEYIEAGDPPPLPYVCDLSDLPLDVTSVRALMTIVRAAKVDGGDGSLQTGIKSGGSTGLGADRPITVAQTYWRDVHETDPNTAAAWSVPAVNAAQLQLDRTV